MTTLDHPDIVLSDKRDRIMAAVAEVIDADHAADLDRRSRLAEDAVAVALNDVLRILEQYGTDTTAGMARWGTCTDAGHGLAWIDTEEGFTFDIVEDGAGTECWLLHPETGERVYRIDYQATWPNAARAIHAADARTVDIGAEPTPPAEHPADVLVEALRAFVESLGSRDHGF